MHKNAYSAKTLNGNWLENRYTEDYDAFDNATSNTYLPNPCKYPRSLMTCQPIASMCLSRRITEIKSPTRR